MIKAELYTPIKLGRSGENMAQVVEFDVADWLEEHGDGTVVLLAQRNGDTAPYPVVIERDGSTVKWTVNSADTARPGFGKAELQLVVGEKVVKSATYSTIVQASLGDPAAETPDPFQEWTAAMAQALARMEELAAACRIFVATYGKTTWAELKAAYDAGKFIVVNRNGYLYGLYMAGNYMEFRQPGTSNAPYCRCLNTSTWQSGNFATTAAPTAHASRHGMDGSDPISPESIGAIPAVGESITDPETSIDDLTLTKCYLLGVTVINNGLKGNLPFGAVSTLLKVEDFSGDGKRAIQTAFKNAVDNPQRKWRLWNGHKWSAWQEG